MTYYSWLKERLDSYRVAECLEINTRAPQRCRKHGAKKERARVGASHRYVYDCPDCWDALCMYQLALAKQWEWEHGTRTLSESTIGVRMESHVRVTQGPKQIAARRKVHAAAERARKLYDVRQQLKELDDALPATKPKRPPKPARGVCGVCGGKRAPKSKHCATCKVGSKPWETPEQRRARVERQKANLERGEAMYCGMDQNRRGAM